METLSQVYLKTLMNSLEAPIASRGANMIRVNISQETRAMTHDQHSDRDQSHRCSLKALPIQNAGGSQ